MSHRLTVLRHAHAEAAPPGGQDIDRPLSTQGTAAARALAPLLASCLPAPQLLRVSPSVRTCQTAELACGVAYPTLRIETAQVLYLAEVDALLREISATPEHVGHVMLVGHNPGLSDLWSLLGGEADFEGLGPGEWRSRELDVDRWNAIG